jgi:hypothetical protein
MKMQRANVNKSKKMYDDPPCNAVWPSMLKSPQKRTSCDETSTQGEGHSTPYLRCA